MQSLVLLTTSRVLHLGSTPPRGLIKKFNSFSTSITMTRYARAAHNSLRYTLTHLQLEFEQYSMKSTAVTSKSAFLKGTSIVETVTLLIHSSPQLSWWVRPSTLKPSSLMSRLPPTTNLIWAQNSDWAHILFMRLTVPQLNTSVQAP